MICRTWLVLLKQQTNCRKRQKDGYGYWSRDRTRGLRTRHWPNNNPNHGLLPPTSSSPPGPLIAMVWISFIIIVNISEVVQPQLCVQRHWKETQDTLQNTANRLTVSFLILPFIFITWTVSVLCFRGLLSFTGVKNNRGRAIRYYVDQKDVKSFIWH